MSICMPVVMLFDIALRFLASFADGFLFIYGFSCYYYASSFMMPELLYGGSILMIRH